MRLKAGDINLKVKRRDSHGMPHTVNSNQKFYFMPFSWKVDSTYMVVLLLASWERFPQFLETFITCSSPLGKGIRASLVEAVDESALLWILKVQWRCISARRRDWQLWPGAIPRVGMLQWMALFESFVTVKKKGVPWNVVGDKGRRKRNRDCYLSYI